MELNEEKSSVLEKQETPRKTLRSTSTQPHVSDIFIKTEIHGLPDWYQAEEKSSKTTWTIILVFVLSFMIYELIKVSLDFKNNPILTTYSIVSEPKGLRFPEIYICPMTPIHEAESISKGRSNGGAQEAMVMGTKPYEPKDIQDFYMNVGYATEKLFKECSFDSIMFNCSEMIEPIFDRDHGKCFLVKASRQRQLLPGVGLSMVLNLDLENATKRSKRSLPLFDGAYLSIHHDFDPATYRKILIKPGLNIQLSLEATHMNLIQRNRPSGGSQKCLPAQQGRENLKILNWTYSLGICHTDCVQSEIWEHCNCVLGMDTRLFKKEITEHSRSVDEIFCNFTQRQECAEDVIAGDSKKNSNNGTKHLANCINSCAFPCDFWEYRAEMSSLDFPSQALIRKELENARQHSRRKRSTTDYTRLEISQKAREFLSKNKAKTPLIKPILQEKYPAALITWTTILTGFTNISKDPYDGLAPGLEAIPTPENEKINKTIDLMDRMNETDLADIVYQCRMLLQQYMLAPEGTFVNYTPSMTFDTFISNIGGQVGLWIGASIVTLLKFFVILWPICMAKLRSVVLCGRKKA